MPLLLVLLLVPIAKDGQDPPVDLSPARWPAGERERSLTDMRTFGGLDAPARGPHGAIAGTTGAPAVRAGLAALEQGGSAADAALTTALTQICLAMGSWVSYAGLFSMVYYDAETGEVWALNACFDTVRGETDPRSIPASGPSGRTALVPGFFAGVDAAHARFGRLPFAALFDPAIEFAEDGFLLTDFHAGLLEWREPVLGRLPETRAVFTKPDGSWYGAGERFRQPALAATLRRVATERSRFLYEGEWAERLVAAVRADGGRLSLEDLAEYEALWAPPLRVSVRDFEVCVPALPAEGGMHLVEALLVAEAAELPALGALRTSPEAFYWQSQITNLAGLSYVEPGIGSLLLGGLDATPDGRLDPDRAVEIWERMREGELSMFPAPSARDPKHSDAVVAIDRWGNVAALVHSINTSSWGETGIFVDGISIPDAASFQQAKIAAACPGRRLPDPTEPVVVLRGGEPVAALASIGSGLHQKTFEALLGLVAHERGLHAAVTAPTFHLPEYGADGRATAQVFEGDFGEELLARVREMGLAVRVVPRGLASRAPRGYVVGAALDASTGERTAVATSTLNARALAH